MCRQQSTPPCHHKGSSSMQTAACWGMSMRAVVTRNRRCSGCQANAHSSHVLSKLRLAWLHELPVHGSKLATHQDCCVLTSPYYRQSAVSTPSQRSRNMPGGHFYNAAGLPWQQAKVVLFPLVIILTGILAAGQARISIASTTGTSDSQDTEQGCQSLHTCR